MSELGAILGVSKAGWHIQVGVYEYDYGHHMASAADAQATLVLSPRTPLLNL